MRSTTCAIAGKTLLLGCAADFERGRSGGVGMHLAGPLSCRVIVTPVSRRRGQSRRRCRNAPTPCSNTVDDDGPTLYPERWSSVLGMIPRVLIAMGVVAAVAATTGCGADKQEACKNIEQEIQTLFQKASTQINDPQALAQTLRDSAEKVRDQGGPVGGDVESASEDAAGALERVADRMADGKTQQSDLQPLLDAGTKLRQACA